MDTIGFKVRGLYFIPPIKVIHTHLGKYQPNDYCGQFDFTLKGLVVPGHRLDTFVLHEVREGHRRDESWLIYLSND